MITRKFGDKTMSTFVTLKRLFSSVYPKMVFEVGLLIETLFTFGPITVERLVTTMDSHMSLEVRRLLEC